MTSTMPGMSSSSEKSFIELPENVLIHMMTFLSKEDLDNLSVTCKTMMDVIFCSDKLMAKYQLILWPTFKFNTPVDSNEIEAVISKRRFKNLRMKYFRQHKSPENFQKIVNFAPQLSESLGNLKIEGCDFNDIESFGMLLAPLRKLKSFIADGIEFRTSNNLALFSAISDFPIENFPIEYLYIKASQNADSTAMQVLNYFSKCTQVKTFIYDGIWHKSIDEFIIKQSELKILEVCYTNVEDDVLIIKDSWNDAQFELEEFLGSHAHIGDPAAAIKFFKKQQKITNLRISFYKKSYDYESIELHREMLQTMSQLANLIELDIEGFIYCVPNDVFKGVVFTKVKQLTLRDGQSDFGFYGNTSVTSEVLNACLNVETIDYYSQFLHLVDVPIATLEKINWEKFCYQSEFKFESSAPPCSIEEFEESITSFLADSYDYLWKIKIGNASWSAHEEFQLSTDFCTQFLQYSREPHSLELFNVDDVDEFYRYAENDILNCFMIINLHQTDSKKTG